MKPAVALVLLLVLGAPACSSGDEAPAPAPTTAPTPASATAPASALSPVLRDVDARLVDASAVRRHGRVLVTAAWQARRRRTIVSSDDRFVSVTQRRWTPARARSAFGAPVDPEPGVLDGLLEQPVATPGGTGEALVGGGDGATLLPFEETARLEGSRWRRFSVPLVSGERAYVGGAVVLADGRLLVLLDHWSGDRRGHASAPYHGLWISDGDDWGSFAPYRPRFVPAPRSPVVALGGTSRRAGLAYARTADGFYVSADGRVFRQTPTRPLL